ncbi:MAG TPA: ImmA/IrrE family metallo-endopeptidase [Candidatus Thermoplasmatota archaeon]|nr:ImmA/IrrE family metallo-endopeptidase [Candidatus Thermoplasmatota archaeon]
MESNLSSQASEKLTKNFLIEFADRIQHQRTLREVKRLFPLIVEKMWTESSQYNPPVNLEPIAKLRKMHTFIKIPRDNHGKLVPDSDGFKIYLSDKDPLNLQRVTIAHEIGHTLFFNLSSSPPSRSPRKNVSNIIQDKEEWLCYDFARELLMPTSKSLKLLQHNYRRPSMEGLYEIARIFQVSLDVVCWRIFRDFRLWQDAAVFFISSNADPLIVKKKYIYRGEKIKKRNIQIRQFLKNHEISTTIKYTFTHPNSEKSVHFLVNNTVFSFHVKNVKKGPYQKVCMIIDESGGKSCTTLNDFDN